MSIKAHQLDDQGRKLAKQLHIFSSEEIDELEIKLTDFKNRWFRCNLDLSRKMLKLHLLLAHLAPFIRQHRFSSTWVSEQDLESLHSKFDCSYKLYNSDEARMQNFLIKFNSLQAKHFLLFNLE